MSKKLIISLSIVLSVVAVVLILFWTLFALSSVSVEYQSTTKNLTITNDEIVEAGKFRYGACVLFEGKKKSIQKIYNTSAENENFAYLRVVNIETVFPNKFVIHVAEREELFAVEDESGQVYICDRDFRVLKIVNNFVFTQSNPILLKGLKILQKNVKIGDFLQIEQKNMKKFYSAMLQNNRQLAEQLAKFKEMELGSYRDAITGKEYISLSMTSFQGRKYLVNNIDFAFAQKFQKLFAAESAIFNQPTDEFGNILNSKNEIMWVIKTETGEYVSYDEKNPEHSVENRIALSYNLLSNCSLKVDNLTLSDHVHRTEKDIYYSFVDLG